MQNTQNRDITVLPFLDKFIKNFYLLLLLEFTIFFNNFKQLRHRFHNLSDLCLITSDS